MTACLFAGVPTNLSVPPSFLLENPTNDGVVLAPSAFWIIFGCDPSNIATAEFVVPKSIPMTAPRVACEYKLCE